MLQSCKICTGWASALMGYDRITRLFLNDRRTWDHWITESAMREIPPGSPLAWQVWHKHTFSDCRWGEACSHLQAASSNRHPALPLESGTHRVNFLRRQNVHQTLFMPLTISCVLHTLSFRQGNKGSQPSSEKHINILFEFLTTTVIWPYDSKKPHKFKDFVSSLCCWYWISNLDWRTNDFGVWELSKKKKKSSEERLKCGSIWLKAA